MPSDLTALSRVRGWLTESLLAYLCQVEADAIDPDDCNDNGGFRD